MSSKPHVVVISGPSGAGKSTLIRRLLQDPGVRLAVSATTRPPRPGEQDGTDYHFVTRTQFDAMKDRGELLEWAEVHGHGYGTPKSEVERDGAEVVLLDIDVQGWRSVRAIDGLHAVSIFIAPPSMEELERRLRGRSSDDERTVSLRLANARTEMAARNEYDHVLVNQDVKQASEELREIVRGALGTSREQDIR